jgi:lipopolysaccharide/colanic/teichoic acid biosynthesis glycosyltransferase
LSTAARHTPIKPLTVDKIPDPIPNGNISSFVASRKNYLIFKRGFDIVFSVIMILLVMSWLFPLIIIFIKTTSKGPVFFRQRRIGRGGSIFYCIKFRTMVLNDEADERQARENDERITAAGKFLRITNLDELPQFFNVLSGDMSVIGPRPHMISDCIRFSFIISSWSLRNLVRPGITGWAQVNGHHGPATDYQSVIERYYWDAKYISEINAKLDGMIILKTIQRVLKNTGKFLADPFWKKNIAPAD